MIVCTREEAGFRVTCEIFTEGLQGEWGTMYEFKFNVSGGPMRHHIRS